MQQCYPFAGDPSWLASTAAGVPGALAKTDYNSFLSIIDGNLKLSN
jgi:hypothetical protein